MRETRFRIERHGQTVKLHGMGQELFFCSQTPEHFSEDDCFAAWALLPVAMATLGDIIIEGNGDAVTEQNVRKMSDIWSEWCPKIFRSVKIRFTSHNPIIKLNSEDELLLFSGGSDAVYNLLRRHNAGKSQTLLTIRGMDYSIGENEAKFQQLIEKTKPIVEMTKSSQIFVETNTPSFYKKLGIGNVGLTHGFTLASALFLMGRNFRIGEISADFARYQEFLAFPWGTNSITNALFESSFFRMQTGCLDVTRSEKLKALLDSPEALSSVSFCINSDSRPHNCGKCQKCVRSKCMYLAATGKIPHIFIDMSLDAKLVIKIIANTISDKNRRTERTFTIETIRLAEENGTISLIPGMKEISNSFYKKPSNLSRFMTRQIKSVKKRMNLPMAFRNF